MGLEDEPPPLPPRNYEWSDVEEDDEDLFQSDDDLDEPSSQISLDDQHAMYSSVSIRCLYSNVPLLQACVHHVPPEEAHFS